MKISLKMGSLSYRSLRGLQVRLHISHKFYIQEARNFSNYDKHLRKVNSTKDNEESFYQRYFGRKLKDSDVTKCFSSPSSNVIRIKKSEFDNDRLLICEVDNKFNTQLFMHFLVIMSCLGASIYFFYKLCKMLQSKKESFETDEDGSVKVIVTSKADGARKYFICAGLLISFSSVIVLSSFLYSDLFKFYGKFIRRIYLLKSGKQLVLDCHTCIITIGLEEFDLVGPQGNSIISSQIYQILLSEGYPIMIQGDYKLLSLHSYVYYKDVLSSLGDKKLLSIIN